MARTFASNINTRRLQLDMTYEDVYARLSERAWSERVKPPSLSAVGNWFNGHRRPRHMEHLRALCEVLQMSVDDALEGEAQPVTAIESELLAAARELSDVQQQALLALAHAMRSK